MTYEIYSKYGRLMDRTDDEAVARRGLRTWPLAWTLVADGQVIDIHPGQVQDAEHNHEAKRV